jgi:hypothetical protein
MKCTFHVFPRCILVLLVGAVLFPTVCVATMGLDNAPLPLLAPGPHLSLKPGAFPCPKKDSTSLVHWDFAAGSQLVPTIVAPIIAGQAASITGKLFSQNGTDPITGKLQFEVWDFATSQLEASSTPPLDIVGQASPYDFKIPIVFPKAGQDKLIFGCFNGSQVFPDFANSYSVADAPGGGGGCVVAHSTSFDPTVPALLALAIGGLWCRRRSGRG